MRWKNALFLAVVCSQFFLVTVLIYLIRSCNKTPVLASEYDERTRKVNGDMKASNLSRRSSYRHSAILSTSKLKLFVTKNNPIDDDKKKSDHLKIKGMENNTRHNENKTSLVINNLDHNRTKKHLKLIVAILSAPIRFDRREGIRRTWMSECTSGEVVCRFFTDSLSDMEPKVQTALTNENARYGDIEFMPIPKGYNFGLRLLWLMEWSVERYEFDFFLRMDDDYFVCLKRLLFEIPFRPQKRLYWGYVHCEVEGLVRIDEGFIILSGDLVREFMSKKASLLCHPFGDQTIAIWMNDVKNVIHFHDPRIHHDVTAHIPEFKSLQEVCGTYISLHGSYLHEMLVYWKIATQNNYSTYWVPSIQPISNLCPLSTRFDWQAMGGPPYGWEPKPCVLKPLWNLGNMHRGRNMM